MKRYEKKWVTHDHYEQLRLSKYHKKKLAEFVAFEIRDTIQKGFGIDGIEELLNLGFQENQIFGSTWEGLLLGFLDEGQWDTWLKRDLGKRWDL